MPKPAEKDKPNTTVAQAPAVPDEWERGLAHWGQEWEASARATGALQRRRKVQTAGDLMRLVLAYSVWDWSLRQVGAWATLLGLAELSDVAVRQRLRRSRAWLSHLVGQALGQVRLAGGQPAVRLRLIDATVITQPGSRGTDWRMHVSFDVGQRRLDEWDVTDAHGGETLVRHAVQAGEIIVGDRAYAHRAGLGHVLGAGAQFVVRTNGHNLPLETAPGQRLDLRAWLAGLAPDVRRRERVVWVTTPAGRARLRLLAQRLPPAAAQAAQRRAAKVSRKKGHTPSALSQRMAGWVVVVTNLPAETWSARDVLALYRVRWQVELLIKRFKSLLAFDQLRTQDPELAQVYLLGKAFGAVLLDQWADPHRHHVRAWFDDLTRPVSLWRWTALWWQQLRALVRGTITLTMFQSALPKLSRYLCDSPRRRRSQLASACHWLQRLNAAWPAPAPDCVPALA
jgi:hypothetical protein